MRKWIVGGLILGALLLVGGITAAIYVVIYGPPGLPPLNGGGRLERELARWRRGDFSGYGRIFTNPDRFEEVLFLNFLRGNLTLACEEADGYLRCKGFSPIRIKPKGTKYEILSTLIYITDTSGSIGRKRRRLADWVSKVKNYTYYEALEICTGQLRDRGKTDSLYLEKKALENDTVVLSKLNRRTWNVRFYELFEDRLLDGHVCLPYGDIWEAHRRFGRYVKADRERMDLSIHLNRRKRDLRRVVAQLEEELQRAHDPLALAFYKRGLQYYSQGDLESARIFFRKALKIEPDFEQAKKSLEKVEALIERGP